MCFMKFRQQDHSIRWFLTNTNCHWSTSGFGWLKDLNGDHTNLNSGETLNNVHTEFP